MPVILIADDSSTARLIIRRCVEIAGGADATLLEARDGQQALDLVRQQHVDIVLTDINMPVLDGKRLLMHIKSNPRLNATRVVVISSMANPALEKELKDIGADAVIPKPVTPAMLQPVFQFLLSPENQP